jgi:putative oxidoreductase
MDKKSSMAMVAARIGLGLIFLGSGLGKLAGWSGTVGYAASKGVPEILLVGAVALELLGAASLLAGWRTRWGVTALIVFLVPVTVVFHAPWTAQGAEVQLQVIQFLKNLSIAGGLLAVAAAGPGLFSLDERRAQGAKAERASWKAVRAS